MLFEAATSPQQGLHPLRFNFNPRQFNTSRNASPAQGNSQLFSNQQVAPPNPVGNAASDILTKKFKDSLLNKFSPSNGFQPINRLQNTISQLFNPGVGTAANAVIGAGTSLSLGTNAGLQAANLTSLIQGQGLMSATSPFAAGGGTGAATASASPGALSGAAGGALAIGGAVALAKVLGLKSPWEMGHKTRRSAGVGVNFQNNSVGNVTGKSNTGVQNQQVTSFGNALNQSVQQYAQDNGLPLPSFNVSVLDKQADGIREGLRIATNGRDWIYPKKGESAADFINRATQLIYAEVENPRITLLDPVKRYQNPTLIQRTAANANSSGISRLFNS